MKYQVEPEGNSGNSEGGRKDNPLGTLPRSSEASRAVTPSPARGHQKRRRIAEPRLLLEQYFLVVVWIVMCVIFSIAAPKTFLQVATFQTIFSGSAVYVLIGLAALCTAVVGDLDLSVPFITGFCATLVPTLVSLHGMNVAIACVITIAISGLAGVMNGLIVVRARVDAFIGTLGTGTVFLAIGEGVSHQGAVSGLSQAFGKIALARFLGLAAIFWYGIILTVFIAYLIAFTPLGRHMTFVGANREVARLAGVRVERIRVGAYVFGAVLAGLAGLLLSAQLRGFEAASSNEYLLPTFATLFLSAAVVRPGRFNAVGIAIAAYFIATGTIGLQILGYSGWIEQLFYGAALVVAVSAVSAVRRFSSSI